MTTFHSDNFVPRASLTTMWASANEPDSIGFEVQCDGKELFSVYFGESGRRSIQFHLAKNAEFDADEFRNLINEAFAGLEEWEKNLRAEGGAWSAL